MHHSLSNFLGIYLNAIKSYEYSGFILRYMAVGELILQIFQM